MAIILSQTFAVITCCNCGIPFAVPQDFQDSRRQDKKYLYCPNGHSQSYAQSEADRLRADLEQSQRHLQQAKNREAAIAQELDKERRATKRLSKRLENGVCPFPGCKRHFTNLQRHVTTEHAGVALPAGSDQKALPPGSVQ